MEQINRIELLGPVGNVRYQDVGDTQVVNFSLVTNFAYMGREGGTFETMWHNVQAWNSKNIPDFQKVERGSIVHVVGRLRFRKFTGSDGLEKQFLEVVASRLDVIKTDEQLKIAVG